MSNKHAKATSTPRTYPIVHPAGFTADQVSGLFDFVMGLVRAEVNHNNTEINTAVSGALARVDKQLRTDINTALSEVASNVDDAVRSVPRTVVFQAGHIPRERVIEHDDAGRIARIVDK